MTYNRNIIPRLIHFIIQTHPPPQKKSRKIADTDIFCASFERIVQTCRGVTIICKLIFVLTNAFTFIEQSGFFNRAFGFLNGGFVHYYRRYMIKILPIRCKTLSIQSINQSINQ